MKPLYRCEYCDVTGTEEEIQKHEEECIKNYNKKSCYTCKHCNTDGFKRAECGKGKEIPDGQYFERCSMHEIGTPKVTGIMSMFTDLFKQGV